LANRYVNAAVALSTTSATDLYTVPGGCSALVQSITVSNEDTVTRTVTGSFYDSSATTTFTLIKDAAIPAASSLNLLDRPFALEEGDKISLTAGTANAFDVTASILLVDESTSVPVGLITTAALADGAVTAEKLAPGAGGGTVEDGSITTAKLASAETDLYVKLATEVFG